MANRVPRSSNPVLEGIIDFHNDLMVLLTVIGVAVFWVIGRAWVLFEENPTPSQVVHGTTLEMIWTIIPAVILMFVAVPSFALLYSIDEILDPAVTLKVVGHQWYWSYEYSDYSSEDGETINFDSYMIPEDDLSDMGQLRLLEVDNNVLPFVFKKLHVNFLILEKLTDKALESLPKVSGGDIVLSPMPPKL